jgi:hypothetical protein
LIDPGNDDDNDNDDAASSYKDDGDGNIGNANVESMPRLEMIVAIPHGRRRGGGPPSSSVAAVDRWSDSGWERRVGQILWNPLLYPSNGSIVGTRWTRRGA